MRVTRDCAQAPVRRSVVRVKLLRRIVAIAPTLDSICLWLLKEE